MSKIEEKIDENYLVLHRVLHDALEQAASGKGKERHAMGEPFEEQLMCLLGRQLGASGPAFQVCKKVVEACRLPYPANVREVLGAINYAAGMVIEFERQAAVAQKAVEHGEKARGILDGYNFEELREALEKSKKTTDVPFGLPLDLSVLKQAPLRIDDTDIVGHEGCSCGCQNTKEWLGGMGTDE